MDETNDKPLAGVVRGINSAYPHGGDNNLWRATIIQRESGMAELVKAAEGLRKLWIDTGGDDENPYVVTFDAALAKLTGDSK